MAFSIITLGIVLSTFLVSLIGIRYIKYRIETYSFIKTIAKVQKIIVKKIGGGENSPPYYRVYLELLYSVGGSNIYKTVPTSIKERVKGRFNKKGYTFDEVREKGSKNYPIGSGYGLFYNAKNPNKSIIKIGIPYSAHYFIRTSYFLLILSVLFIFTDLLTISSFSVIDFLLLLVSLLIFMYSMILTNEGKNKLFVNKDLIIDNKSYYGNPYTPYNLSSNPSKNEYYPESNYKSPINDKFCFKCGTMVSLDDKYCPECGYKIN